jgi:hypothetical protein
MLTRLSGDTTRKILLALPEAVRKKFAHPRVPDAVHDFYGETEQEICSRAIMEIAYAEDCIADGLGRDGNWLEFTTWTGLTQEDMDLIKAEMVKLGWKNYLERM